MRWLEASGHGCSPRVGNTDKTDVQRVPQLTLRTVSAQQTHRPSRRRRNRVITYEVRRTNRDDAVADGKCSLVSIKIATQSEIFFAQQLSSCM
jgi:hypothetical protein